MFSLNLRTATRAVMLFCIFSLVLVTIIETSLGQNFNPYGRADERFLKCNVGRKVETLSNPNQCYEENIMSELVPPGCKDEFNKGASIGRVAHAIDETIKTNPSHRLNAVLANAKERNTNIHYEGMTAFGTPEEPFYRFLFSDRYREEQLESKTYRTSVTLQGKRNTAEATTHSPRGADDGCDWKLNSVETDLSYQMVMAMRDTILEWCSGKIAWPKRTN